MAEEEPKEERPKLASRDEVIEASRRRYGMPRAEVERLIALQMGYPTPEEQRNQHRDHLFHELTELGVTERQAKYLQGEYSQERIEKQLAWLPFRHPRNPSALIICAIRYDYEPPEGLYVQVVDNINVPRDDRNSTPKQEPNTERKPNANG